MSIERKVQNETGRNPYRIGVNVLLLVAFFLLFHPLLSKGSLMYQPTISHWLTAGAFVPLVLRPWRRNHPFAENHTQLYAAILLVHDVLLFLSAAAVSLILVEYMVKGCVITLKQSFFQGWICQSVTSSINPTPSSLQFILRTQEISTDDDDDAVTSDQDAADEGVLARIVNIFKKLASAIYGVFASEE